LSGRNDQVEKKTKEKKMIDFTFTEEQEMFRQAAREFAETQVAPRVPEMEETGEVNAQVVKALGEAEMMALTIPAEYGGLGLGYVARLIALEEISKVSVATAMMLQVFALGIEPIILFGTEEQKTKYLPGLATGERLATVAVTEATGGSDPTSGRTSYAKDGDDYVINGRKCFITNSHIADTITVLAKDDQDPKTFSAFIVEKGMEGFRPTHKEHKVACGVVTPASWPLKIARSPGKICWERKERACALPWPPSARSAGAVWSAVPWGYRPPAWKHP
jgi:alkylation response protein AidB-like acyl-CoA dehydrogenase